MHTKHFKWIMALFLILTAGLTFFSKTLYNLRLPVVETVTPGQGKIVDKVEGHGQVTDKNTFRIFAQNSGRVAEILVNMNDSVKAGEALLRLEPAEEEAADLEEAILSKEDSLELLRLELSLLNISNSDETAQYYEKIKNLEEESIEIEEEISQIDSSAFSDGKTEGFIRNIETLKKQADEKEKLYRAGGLSLAEAETARAEAENEEFMYRQYLMEEREIRTDRLDELTEDITAQENAIKDTLSERDKQEQNSSYDRRSLQQQIGAAQRELERLKKDLKNTSETVISAPFDTLVTAIHVEAGLSFERNDAIIELSEPSGEYKTEMTVTEKERELIQSDSIVEIWPIGSRSYINGQIISLLPSKENPSDYQISIAFKYDGENLAGSPVSIIIKEESDIYSFILPNQAVRKDNKGYYVLGLNEEKGIFGTTYITKRTDVTLLNSDISYSAVSGLGIIGPVVLKSDKIVDSNMRVRSEENITFEATEEGKVYSFKPAEDFTGIPLTGIIQLEDEGFYLSYFSQGRVSASSSLQTQDCVLTETNENYAGIMKLNLTEGTFFNESQTEKGILAAVINSTAAEALFGTLNCVGESLSLSGESKGNYTVAGVFKSNDENKQAEIIIPWDEENSEAPAELVISLSRESFLGYVLDAVGFAEEDMEIAKHYPAK